MKVAFRNNMIRLVKSNFTVFRFILIGIVIFFEFDPDLTSLFDIAIKNISLFFIIPLNIKAAASPVRLRLLFKPCTVYTTIKNRQKYYLLSVKIR